MQFVSFVQICETSATEEHNNEQYYHDFNFYALMREIRSKLSQFVLLPSVCVQLTLTSHKSTF